MIDFPATIRDIDLERTGAHGSEFGFVVDHWLESLYAGGGYRARERIRSWKLVERPIVAGLIRNDVCVVACDPLDEDRLYGFACGSGDALHYVFARQTRRRGGLGSALLHALMARGVVPTRHTYTTRDGRAWWAEAKRTRQAA